MGCGAVGFRLSLALNARPSGPRRAALQPEPNRRARDQDPGQSNPRETNKPKEETDKNHRDEKLKNKNTSTYGGPNQMIKVSQVRLTKASRTRGFFSLPWDW